jgi:hypothetical protein
VKYFGTVFGPHLTHGAERAEAAVEQRLVGLLPDVVLLNGRLPHAVRCAQEARQEDVALSAPLRIMSEQ